MVGHYLVAHCIALKFMNYSGSLSRDILKPLAICVTIYILVTKVTNLHVLQKINIKSTELVQMIRTRKAKF